jgi:hypothetical protein
MFFYYILQTPLEHRRDRRRRKIPHEDRRRLTPPALAQIKDALGDRLRRAGDRDRFRRAGDRIRFGIFFSFSFMFFF